jgi:hypothetical protein
MIRTEGIPFLRRAAAQWRKAAASTLAFENPAHADECLRAADSIELEIETGFVYCSCHLVPVESCPRRRKQ